MVYSSTIKNREIRFFGVSLRQLREVIQILWDDTLLMRYKHTKPIFQHIKLDLPWPAPNKLENICEQIGKEVHEQDRRIDVPYSGLLHHLFFNLGKKYRSCGYMGDDFFVEWGELRKNRLHKGYVNGREGFATIKLFDPNDTFGNVLPVLAEDVTKNQAQSFIGALIEIEGQGKYYGNMEVFICSGGQTFHGSNIAPFDKPTKLEEETPTHMIFYGLGRLSELQEMIIGRYKELSKAYKPTLQP